MEGKENRFKNVNILQFLGVFLFAIFMLLLFLREQKPESLNLSSKKEVRDAEKHSQKVSVHLKDLEKRLQVERDKTYLENMKVGPAPSLFGGREERLDEHGVQIVQENDSIVEDLRGQSEYEDSKLNPREYIYNELSLKANKETEDIIDGLKLEKDQETYIRNVLKRARKDGYELIINKNLVVVGYRKIDPFTGEVSPKVYHLERPKYGR